MAQSPPRPCARCGRFVRGRCPRCTALRQKDADARRPSASARGYDGEWAKFANDWLSRYPWCGQRLDGQLHPEHSLCVQMNRRTYAECVDHIVSLRVAPRRRLDRTNVQSLCGACNRRKGIRHEGGFGREPRTVESVGGTTPADRTDDPEPKK